jgi:hypothetical protein
MKTFALMAALATPLPAAAQGFAPVRDKQVFVDLIAEKSLTRFGITLNVSANGTIRGRAFGTEVTGNWTWKSGLFCREMSYGSKSIPHNCQTVHRSGNTLRFTSDAGAGQSADLRLK